MIDQSLHLDFVKLKCSHGSQIYEGKFILNSGGPETCGKSHQHVECFVSTNWASY